MGLTRKLKRERMLKKKEVLMAGEGLFIYQNITGADLMLPRPTKSGRRTVGPREKFMGDSYYKTLKDVVCLQEITPNMPEQKLITEQPPTITHEGKVEYVEKKPDEKPMNEEKKKQEQHQPPEQVLLTELPLEGIRIMR
jgi:hypothetical protein